MVYKVLIRGDDGKMRFQEVKGTLVDWQKDVTEGKGYSESEDRAWSLKFAMDYRRGEQFDFGGGKHGTCAWVITELSTGMRACFGKTREEAVGKLVRLMNDEMGRWTVIGLLDRAVKRWEQELGWKTGGM